MLEQKTAPITGLDIPIGKLIPVRKRKVSKKDYSQLLANLKAVGLIDPFCVCREGDEFLILDGNVRYAALLELGVETVPCLVLGSPDLYTPNRQVNHLSSREKVQMLRKALDRLDEESIARAFGMDSVRTRLNTALYLDLHANVVAELEAGRLAQSAAKELTYVTPKRQLEILAVMREGGDWSVAFAKAQVLMTPAPMRNAKKQRGTPWQRAQKNKSDLARKMAEVEKHYNFYSGLYRQYVGDLLKLAIYIRQIVTCPELRDHLAAHHPEELAFFESVVATREGKNGE